MIQMLTDAFSAVQGWLFETLIEPFIYQFGLGEFTEQAFEGTEWFLIGLCEIALLYVLLRPLEAWLPVRPLRDRHARRIDFLYTVLHRVGIFAVFIFFVLDPVMDGVMAELHLRGVPTFNLENLWPSITPLGSFLVYLLVLDFFDYLYHRAEHHFNWWWGLHSLHHSQRDMNLWSDNRNHLLDDFLRDIYMAVIALAIGVQPGQYVLLVSFSRILQSLQHANVRIHFGTLGERLLVSPRYHRTHHAVKIGHESGGNGTLGGCNFAVLFPVWDLLFRTARFDPAYYETGVRDQLPRLEAGAGEHGVAGRDFERDYGRGFWAQQWSGLKRMVEFMKRKNT